MLLSLSDKPLWGPQEGLGEHGLKEESGYRSSQARGGGGRDWVFPRAREQVPQTGSVKPRAPLSGQRSDSKVWAGSSAPAGAPRETPSQASLPAPGIANHPWCPWLVDAPPSLCVIHSVVCVHVQISPFLQGHLSLDWDPS